MNHEVWYILFGGTSEDGRGRGTYIGRTTDKTVAKKHYEHCRKDPYSTGRVVIYTDTSASEASPFTQWEAYP